VFAAARELINADYLTVHPGMAPDILRRALSRAGVDPKADDPALKQPMLRVIRDVLIPALPVLTLIGELARQGHALTLIGAFPGLQTTLADVRIIPLQQYTPAVWDDVALYVHFSPQGTFSAHLWDAVAAQVAIVTPQPRTADEWSLPGVFVSQRAHGTPGAGQKGHAPELEIAVPAPNQLLSSIKALLNDPPRRQKLAFHAAATLYYPAHLYFSGNEQA